MYLKSVIFAVTFSLLSGHACGHVLAENINGEKNCIESLKFNVDRETSTANIVQKRDTSDAETTTVSAEQLSTTPPSEETTEPEVPNDTSSSDLNPEEFVGQAPSNRRNFQRQIPQRRQNNPRSISVEQQRIVIQQINDHLNRLSHISDQRVRDVEVEAIRNILRQLSNTNLSQTTQQRSRGRNLLEESRKKQRPRVLHSRVVGTAFPNFKEEEEKEDGVEMAVKEIFHGKRRHFEVITQDPKLIDE